MGFIKNYYGRGKLNLKHFLKRIPIINFKGGLVDSQNLVFIMNALISPIMKLINPSYWLNVYYRRKEKNKGSQSVLTQEEAQR